MSLADRKKQAQEEEKTKNQLADGDYQVRLKDWKFGPSKKGKDMYTLTWKIMALIGATGNGSIKGKERRTYYVVSLNWSLVALLDILEQAGANLEAVEDESEIGNILEQIEDTKMPKAIMTVENREGEQHPNITISQVEQVLRLPPPAQTGKGKTTGKAGAKPAPATEEKEDPESPE